MNQQDGTNARTRVALDCGEIGTPDRIHVVDWDTDAFIAAFATYAETLRNYPDVLVVRDGGIPTSPNLIPLRACLGAIVATRTF